MICEMGEFGDNRLEWNRHNPDEVAAARTYFDSLRGKGYLAFARQPNGDRGRQLEDFDPAAERIIMIPPVRGG
jgi:hypothetical protein